MNKQLSIIVPVYNVEKYIYKCIDSLYHQGLSDDIFEVIIVNDGTKDMSMEIVSSFTDQHSNIKIISQENQGLSVARNNGLAHAEGDYILFVDSDDFLVDNSLAIILRTALDSSADILIADYLKLTDEEIEKSVLVSNISNYNPSVMKGRDAFLQFFNPSECYIWRTLYRYGFLEKKRLFFIPNLYFEDIPFTTECYLMVEKAVLFPLPFYVYRQHENSIVSSINKRKLLDLNQIIERLWGMLHSETLLKEEHNKMIDTIFTTFSIEMWYLSHEKTLFPYRKAIIENLKERIPNLFFSNGAKQIMISMLYKYIPFFYLRIRSLKVFK